MEKILLVQFIAHLAADFFAQPECVSEKKREHILGSWHIYAHALIVFAASAVATFTRGFVLWAGVIAVAHFCMDALKCTIERNTKNGHRILFFGDQIAHLAVIYIAVCLYGAGGGTIPGCAGFFTTYQLLLAICVMLCLKPANVLIRICLSSLKAIPGIGDSLKNEGVQKAGRWIGSIERVMTFLLVLLGQYTAIGFIIAAKSVLRYNDTGKAEYVLVGTLMSFGIAFVLGMGMTSVIFKSVIELITCN